MSLEVTFYINAAQRKRISSHSLWLIIATASVDLQIEGIQSTASFARTIQGAGRMVTRH
jgi:hypothetical protein